MNKMKLITIISWLVAAAVILGLIFWLFTGNLFGFNTGFRFNFPNFSIGSFWDIGGPYEEVGSYTVDADNIQSLDVDWASGDIKITPYDGTDIQIVEFARRELRDGEALVYAMHSGALEIDYTEPGLTIFNLSKKLEVYVPEALVESLRTVTIDTASADIHLSDFELSLLDVSDTSGDTWLTDVSADTAKIEAVSGDINISGLTSQMLSFSTVSGDVKFSDVTGTEVTGHSTSGDQSLSGSLGSLDTGSVSGDISIDSLVTPDAIRCGTTSGDIVVTLSASVTLDITYSTVSGRMTSEIPIRNAGGSAPYSFSTVSGDITLKAA